MKSQDISSDNKNQGIVLDKNPKLQYNQPTIDTLLAKIRTLSGDVGPDDGLGGAGHS